jgi:hypothetical protein
MDTREAKALSLYYLFVSLILYFAIRALYGDDFSTIFSKNLPDAIATVAALAAGVWITLAVVEHALKEDQKRQWKKLRESTFSEIMNYVSYIAVSVPFFMFPALTEDDRKKSIEIGETIQNKMHNYKKEGKMAADAVLKLQQLLINTYDYISVTGGKASEEQEKAIIEHMKSAYEDTKFMFDVIRTVLLPRVLGFSENDNLRQALINFEIASLECDNLMRSLSSPLYPIKPGLQILASLIKLLEPAACVCWFIVDDLEKDP